MQRVDQYDYYWDGYIQVSKLIKVECYHGKPDLLIEKIPVVKVCGRLIAGVSLEKNTDGDVIKRAFHLQGANKLIALLDGFLSGKVPRSMRQLEIGNFVVTATVSKQGTSNLCLVFEEDQAVKSTLYLTPFQATNLRNCLYHLLSSISRT